MKRSKNKSRKSKFPKAVLTLICLAILGLFTEASKLIEPISLPSSEHPLEIYSNSGTHDLSHAFQHAIASAEKSLSLTIYALTDEAMIAALREKANKGVDVLIVCDAKASPFVEKRLGDRIKVVKRFAKGLMHQKVLTIDDKITLIGSANFTSESLKMHDNLVIAFENPALAKAAAAKTASMPEYGLSPHFSPLNTTIGGQTVSLSFLPDDSQAVNKIKQLIRSAQKTIRVAMFTWTRQDFAHEIIKAAKRGVDVKVIIDHNSGKGASSGVVALLKQNHLPVKLSEGKTLLHHKMMWIDDNILVNGSANWTKAAFNQNDDCFTIISNLSPAQNKTIEQVWQHAWSRGHNP